MARQLAERLASLPEVEMRRAVLAGWLGEVSPEEAVEVLGCVLRESHSGPAMYQIALGALVALRRPSPEPGGSQTELPYPLERALYIEARARTAELAHLFFSTTVAASEAPQRRPLEMAGRPLTLGERKQLARAGRRDLAVKLLQDPNPEVVARALSHPRITEADVVRLTARRPTEAEVQQAIFANDKWSLRKPVLRALALNPYTPRELTVRVVTLLSASDLDDVAKDPNLDAAVRETASGLLAALKGSRKNEPAS